MDGSLYRATQLPADEMWKARLEYRERQYYENSLQISARYYKAWTSILNVKLTDFSHNLKLYSLYATNAEAFERRRYRMQSIDPEVGRTLRDSRVIGQTDYRVHTYD